MVSVFRVPPEVAGQRLDLFVQSQLRRTSRTRTQEIIRLSAFDSAGRRMKPNDRVRAEQQVFLWRAPWDETPVPTFLGILYEDEHFLAIDKPAHLPVHPSARYHKNTLIKLLQAERPGDFLSLVHRLDRETSGVILVSKSPECDRKIKRQFELRQAIEKTYFAISWGVPDFGNGERSLRFEQSVELDTTNLYRVKMRLGQTENALHAVTTFDIEDIATSAAGQKYARVRCLLETGRQHQIRLHLRALGAPIVGDKLYGPDEGLFARSVDGELTAEDLAVLEIPRHALHAARLTLDHPMTRERLTIEAPIPTDLAQFWNSIA